MVTSDKPFFDPGAGTSQMSNGAVTQSSELIFTIATQPVEAPVARSEVHSQPTGIGSVDVRPNQSLTSRKTVTGVSDSNDELHSEPGSPDGVTDQVELSDRDTSKDEGLDQELSEEANYRETIRGVRSFMGWHQIPHFDSSSSSLDDNPFASVRAQLTGKVSIKLPADEWLCRKLEKSNLAMAEGYPSRNSETAELLRDQFIKTPGSSRWYDMFTKKKDFVRLKVLS